MAGVGFEGVVAPNSFGPVPNGYAGLNWSEFGVLGARFIEPFNMPGYDSVMKGKVVGFAGADGGVPVNSTISAAPGQTFTIKGGTFAAAWNEDEQVTFTGFKANGAVKGTLTVVMDQTAQNIAFDNGFKHIASFRITSVGGTDADPEDSGVGAFVALDDLKITIDEMAAPDVVAPHPWLAHADSGFDGGLSHWNDWMFI